MIERSSLRKYQGIRRVINSGLKPITGVSIDTRTMENGNMFFALKTQQNDGHNYIETAIKKDASVIVINHKWNEEHTNNSGTEFWVVDDTLTALQEMASLHRQKFSIPVIGLTGSNGKTTTKEMISHILSSRYQVLSNKGNYNNHLGVPLTLFGIEAKHEIAVVEMGTNHSGEIQRLCEIARPNMGIITNIGTAHIGNFSDRQSLVNEKKSLYDFVYDESGTIITNTFDPETNMDHCDGSVLRVGANQDDYIYSQNVEIDADTLGISFDVNGSDMVHLNIPGYHNRINALLAMAVAKYFDITVTDSSALISKFKAFDKRMEVITLDDLTVVNDCYNASPESMAEAIKYVNDAAQMSNRNLFLILGDMLELGDSSPDYHRALVDLINPELVKKIWLTGPHMKVLADEIIAKGWNMPIHYAEEPEAMRAQMAGSMPADGIVLVKASRGMHLEDAVDTLVEEKGVQAC